MHLNYYFLSRLAIELKERLTGSWLAEVFTQQKDEVIMGFAMPENDFYIKCLLGPGIQGFSFPDDFNRARKNSADLFKNAIDKKVMDVFATHQDRSFGLVLENDFVLFFKMHGSKSNIIFFQGDKAIEQYHKNYEDLGIRYQDYQKPDSFSIDNLIQHQFQVNKLLPALGIQPLNWLKQENYENRSEEEKTELVCSMLETLHHPEHYYILNDNSKAVLSFFLTHPVLQKLDTAIEAANAFQKYYFTFTEKNKLLAAESKSLLQRKTKLENYISGSIQKLKELKENNASIQAGDILMANLQHIPPRSETVTLYDFYADKDREIKLKKDLSPQKNAENYYRKGKNLVLDIQNLERVVEIKKKELEEIKLGLENLENNNFKRKNQEKTIVQESSPFKKFEYEGFEIRVGKSSEKNDHLLQLSNKNDLWLHARGYAGSHVIVRHIPGIPFPDKVIEKAASLAAYYSKGKTNNLCPVIVTEKKFVRKSKGMAAGQVIVEKEKTVIVTPSEF